VAIVDGAGKRQALLGMMQRILVAPEEEREQ